MKPVVFGWHAVSPLSLVPGCKYVSLAGLKWKNGELDSSVVGKLNDACRKHKIDRLLAIDLPSISLLARCGGALSAAQVCALPKAETLQALHNKWEFSRIIDHLGLPQPKTELARNANELLATRLAFPIITKPVDRWASVGFQRHDSADSLAQTIGSKKLGCEFPMIVQEFIPGQDAGFAFIARRGKLVAHAGFVQPRQGVRRYFNAPVLHRHVARLVAHTGYHGVGEVDARYDPARDEYRLLEVNPRFWASLLYAEHAGMNFPEMLVKMHEINEGKGFTGDTREVKLSPYEFAMGKAVQVSEKAHSAINRWRGI